MTKLKEIKIILKSSKNWRKYKHKFHHKQMQFLFSKIVLIFQPDIDINKLAKQEILMLNTDKKDGDAMFLKIFENMQEFTGVKANWEEFAKFIWYVYQTSTYWKDSRKNIPNVFNKKNYIEKNRIKREHYYHWLYSMDIKENFNNNVIKVLKEVF